MKLFRMLSVAFAAITLAACQQPTNNYAQRPSSGIKLIIDLPASLTPTTAPYAAAGLSRNSGSATSAYTSAGYAMLYGSLTMVETIVPGLAVTSVMVDALISQNGVTPSNTKHTGMHVTVTQAMLSQMSAALPASLRGNMGPQLPALGDAVFPFDFVYNTSLNADFAYQLDVYQAGGALMETLYYSADWSRFGIGMSMGATSINLANDMATSSFAFKLSGGGMEYAVKYKADAANSALHGAFVAMTMGTGTVSGYGDDHGGAVEMAMPDMGWGAGLYLENFNATGQVTYQSYQTGSSTPEVYVGTVPDANYGAKLTNTSWGDASTFFP